MQTCSTTEVVVVVLVAVVIAGLVMEVMGVLEILTLAVVLEVLTLAVVLVSRAAVSAPLVGPARGIQVVASVHTIQEDLQVLVVLILVDQVGLESLDRVVLVGLEILDRAARVEGDRVDLVKAITTEAVVTLADLRGALVVLDLTEMTILNPGTDPSDSVS